MATGDWLHVCDADEEMVDTDKAAVREWRRSEQVPNILMTRERVVYFGGDAIVGVMPRLISRSSGVRYIFPVQEQLGITDEKARVTDVAVLHHGHSSNKGLKRKKRRNLEIALGMGDKPSGMHSAARAALAFKDWTLGMSKAQASVDVSVLDPKVRLEACTLGGAGALFAQDFDSAEKFVAIGLKIDPKAPDILLLSGDVAGAQCLREAEHSEPTPDAPIVAPPLFTHSVQRVRRALHVGSSGIWGFEYLARGRAGMVWNRFFTEYEKARGKVNPIRAQPV